MACVLEEHVEGRESYDCQQQLARHLAREAEAVAEAAVVLGLQAAYYLRFLLAHLLAFAHYVVARHDHLAAVAYLRQTAVELQGRARLVGHQVGHQQAVAQQAGVEVGEAHEVAPFVHAAHVALQQHHLAPVERAHALGHGYVAAAVDAVHLPFQPAALAAVEPPAAALQPLQRRGARRRVLAVVEDGLVALAFLLAAYLVGALKHSKIVRSHKVRIAPYRTHLVVVVQSVARVRENDHNGHRRHQHY